MSRERPPPMSQGEEGSLQEQLAAALQALQALQCRVQSLEARLVDKPPQNEDSRASDTTPMEYLQRSLNLANGARGACGTAANRLAGPVDAPAASRPPLPATAGGGSTMPRPLQPEVPMGTTRMVMAQIVSPADSNGLDICLVS